MSIRFEPLERRAMLNAAFPSSPPGATENLNGAIAINGTTGNDTISVAVAGNDLNVSVNAQTQSFSLPAVTSIKIFAGSGDDTVNVGENIPAVYVSGGRGDDTISALNSAPDTLRGGLGSDHLFAGSGFLNGGPGNDVLNLGAGGTLFGGGGNDELLGGSDTPSILNGGNGNDTLYALFAGGTLSGGAGNDVLTFGPAITDPIMFGGDPIRLPADQPLSPSAVNATNASISVNVPFPPYAPALLLGGPGNDTLSASPSGHDTLDGNGGNNALDDEQDGDTGGNNFLAGGPGNDTITGAFGTSGADSLRGGGGIDSISQGPRDKLILL